MYCFTHQACAINNQDEYNAVINILSDATHHRIFHLCVHLESQLLVAQVNHAYTIYDLLLFHRYLRVQLLCCQLDTVTFIHILRGSNTYVDYLANEVLDWHLSPCINPTTTSTI